jgi:NADPH:quinone reductase-like Zn-dependent oxidoreductase
MQVARIHEHGPPEVIRVEDVPAPVAGPGEVLVRVLAVSVNHLDLWVRRGMPGVTVPMPRILGCDATGEVVALGAGVTGIAPGARVVLEPGFSSGTSEHDRAGNDHLSDDYGVRGEHADGFARELATVERRFLTPLPEGLDPVQAAAVPLVFLTAWGMLVTRAQLRAGETVLVLAGTSGVGSAAIQIAKDAGARVLATAGTEEKRALCLALGADHAVDHGRPDWGKEVKSLTGGRGADVVVEHVGPATWDTSLRCLARNGRLVTCGGTTGPKVALQLPPLFIKNLSVQGSTMGPRAALGTILSKVRSGAYRPVVDRVLPLSSIVLAHDLLERRQVAGKIVLVPDGLNP